MTYPISFLATDERDGVTESVSVQVGLDPRRGALTAAQAGLLEACAAQWVQLPPEVAARANGAVDAATGLRSGQG